MSLSLHCPIYCASFVSFDALCANSPKRPRSECRDNTVGRRCRTVLAIVIAHVVGTRVVGAVVGADARSLRSVDRGTTVRIGNAALAPSAASAR